VFVKVLSNNLAIRRKQMKYDVTAIALDPMTGAVLAGPRTDRIDPETNDLFRECRGPWEIEDAYEAFWNRLDDSWERGVPCSPEKIKVLRVTEIWDGDDQADSDLWPSGAGTVLN
jgi:hypothetical protein